VSHKLPNVKSSLEAESALAKTVMNVLDPEMTGGIQNSVDRIIFIRLLSWNLLRESVTYRH
jgi:hypothetical protein